MRCIEKTLVFYRTFGNLLEVQAVIQLTQSTNETPIILVALKNLFFKHQTHRTCFEIQEFLG